jgi:hypothetical protein
MEEGNARGELVQVQLALEDSGRPAEERRQLRQREGELLKQHARQWLGDLGRFFDGPWSGPDKPYHYQFVRGWLDLLRVLPFPDAILAALARSPEARLLRRLEVVYDMRYHPFEFDQFTNGPNAALTGNETPNESYEEAALLPPLLGSPYLSNLRAFKFGFSDTGHPPGHSTMISLFQDCNAEQVIELLRKCSRLEELYLNTSLPGIDRLFALPTLGNIRVLQYYYGSDYTANNPAGPYPLASLANNASLKRLTTLRLHPGREATIDLAGFDAILRSPHLPSLSHLQVRMTTFGDQACASIVESGILKRLKVLDMGHGNLTDTSARQLAACADLKNLEVLDVSRNALTDDGVAALRGAGIQVVADEQHGAGDEEYLFEVDLE